MCPPPAHDQSTHTIDWLDDSSFSRISGEVDHNTLGRTLTSRQAEINSPLLNYVGAGAHTGVRLGFSEDRTRIEGIELLTTRPRGDDAVFAGTPQPAVIPTFSTGDWSWFESLHPDHYVLDPATGAPWREGIQVTVVPEPGSAVLGLLGLRLTLLWQKSLGRSRR